MNLENNELLNRYLHEMTRYMSYEKAQESKEDILSIIADEIGENPSENEVVNYLKKLGNPYSLAGQYESRSNILITGKNYDVYAKFLRNLSITMIFAIILSYITGVIRNVSFSNLLQIILSGMITIFISTTISFFIAEKVKSTKIITSLIKDFNIKELYRKRYKKVKPSIKILIMIYAFAIFYILIFLKINNEEDSLYKTFQIIFFLFILRDVNKISETYYRKIVLSLMVIADVLSITALTVIISRGFVVDSLVSKMIIVVLLCTIYDLIMAFFKILKVRGLN